MKHGWREEKECDGVNEGLPFRWVSPEVNKGPRVFAKPTTHSYSSLTAPSYFQVCHLDPERADGT